MAYTMLVPAYKAVTNHLLNYYNLFPASQIPYGIPRVSPFSPDPELRFHTLAKVLHLGGTCTVHGAYTGTYWYISDSHRRPMGPVVVVL